jgi:hypothetical protein
VPSAGSQKVLIGHVTGVRNTLIWKFKSYYQGKLPLIPHKEDRHNLMMTMGLKKFKLIAVTKFSRQQRVSTKKIPLPMTQYFMKTYISTF